MRVCECSRSDPLDTDIGHSLRQPSPARTSIDKLYATLIVPKRQHRRVQQFLRSYQALISRERAYLPTTDDTQGECPLMQWSGVQKHSQKQVPVTIRLIAAPDMALGTEGLVGDLT